MMELLLLRARKLLPKSKQHNAALEPGFRLEITGFTRLPSVLGLEKEMNKRCGICMISVGFTMKLEGRVMTSEDRDHPSVWFFDRTQSYSFFSFLLLISFV